MNYDLSEFLSAVRTGSQAVRRAAARGLDRVGLQILSEAQDKCPIDTGHLQNSAVGVPAEVTDGAITKTIGFNAAYAAAVHENLNAHFNTQANPNAQAKFLESTMRQWEDRFGPALADAVQEAGNG